MRPKKRDFFNTNSKNKKGVSIVIGYILLVTFAVIMGGIIFYWLKTYVPREKLECPDGVSLRLENAVFDCDSNYQLSITVKNNGRFDVGGYFIHATENENQEIAVLNLVDYFSGGGQKSGNSIIFVDGENALAVNEDKTTSFNIGKEIFTVEVIPTRWQIEENKKRYVSCSNAKIKEKIYCA